MTLGDSAVPPPPDADDPIRARARAIRDLIGKSELEAAKAKLLGFAREYAASDLEDEALLLSQRLASITAEHLRTGKDVHVERTQIAEALLKLVKELEQYATAQSATGSGGSDPRRSSGFIRTDRRSSTRPRSRLEEARDAFRSRPEPPAEPASDTVVECRGISRQYKRSATAFQLKDVNLTLRTGRITGLIGENGAGKSTLLRIVAGELAHTGGELRYPRLGQSARWSQLRSRIAYIAQQPSRWYGPLCETLHLAAAGGGLHGEANHHEVDFWIHRLGLERYREAIWTELSGGYKVRFELARALLTRPALLILDEPLAALDVIAQNTFLQDLRDLTDDRSGPETMLVSSQHLHEIELIADQLLFLRQGRVVYSGSLSELQGRWPDHLYEITCRGAGSQLEQALDEIGVLDKEFLAGRNLVRTSQEIKPAALLGQLLARNIEVSYFHDISSSTRRLFERDGGP